MDLSHSAARLATSAVAIAPSHHRRLRVRYVNIDARMPQPDRGLGEGVTMATKSKRSKIKIAPYDSADYLNTEEDIKNYLEAIFEEPMDRQMLIHTLGVVARARGMMKLSKDTGITRAGLYKAVSPDGNPSFEAVTKIIGAFAGHQRTSPDCLSRGSASARLAFQR
jgi:probable addiction module antidote protein